MNPAEVFRRIQEIGIIPALRTADVSGAVRAAAAICGGGIPILEISLAPPGALAVLEAVAKAQGSEMLIGAGTVLDADTVRRASQTGAQFIVTTGFSSAVVETAARSSLAIFAGAMTPTEVQTASLARPEAVKLFPCYAIGGPRYIKTLRGQYPHVDLIASGGVTLENCAEYLQAGACAVGVGGEIADAESIATGNHRVFAERARRFRKAITEAQPRGSVQQG